MARLRFDTDIGSSIKAVNDMGAAYNKLGDVVEGSTKQMNALEKAAKRLVDANLTPQERYNQKLETMARAVKAGKLSMEDAERTAGRLGARLDDAGKSSSKLFGPDMLNNVKSYLTGMVSISAAVALFRSEMEAIRAEAERIAQTQLGAAPARDVLKRNIATLGPVEATKFEARASKMASELRLPQSKVDIALANAFAPSGGDVDQTFNRVRVAGQYLKTAPEDIGAFAGTLGDIAKSTGSKDDLRNLGFMIQIGSMSRITDAAAQAKNIPGALAGATKFGATAEEAGALFAATSVHAADFEGATSGTGVIAVTQQLDKFFGAQVKDSKFKAGDVDTFAERLGELRRDPTLASAFVGGVSLEKKVLGPLRQFLLDPNSDIAKEYEKNLGGFGTTGQQRKVAQETIGYLGQGRLAGTAEVSRTISTGIEQFDLGQDAMLTGDDRNKIVTRAWQLRGGSRMQRAASIGATTGAVMSPEEAIAVLQGEVNRASAFQGPAGGFGAMGPANKELIDNTKAMIDALEAIRDQQREQIKAPRPSGRPE